VRVLVLTRLFPSAQNPSLGMFIHRRTAALAEVCDVAVVALSTADGLPEREHMDALDVIRPRWRRLPKVGVLVDGRSYAATAARAVERFHLEFDLIDSHWLYPDGYAAARLGRRLGKPVVVTGRGTDVNELCFRWPFRRLARRALREATRLVAVSRPLKDRMVEAGADAERISVVHNGIDADTFHPATDRADVRRRLGIPDGQVALLSAGALGEAKGFHDLVASMAGVRGGRTAHLYVAGEGAYRAALEQCVAEYGAGENVTLLGGVPQADLVAWYQAADLFCFGSWREGCPNVVLEALACGLPVLSTPVGAVPDLVEEGRDGLLFEAHSPTAFAHALERALAADWDRAAIARRGAQRSWDHVAREYLAVFEQALDDWRAKP